MQSDDDFAGAELLEGVFDAVGYVGCDSYLRLHANVGGCCLLGNLLQ